MNLLGTPETNRRGLKTRNALNALTSKPSIWRVDKIVLTTLENTISKSLLVVARDQKIEPSRGSRFGVRIRKFARSVLSRL